MFLIVGIDPGTTYGWAMLNLKGELKELGSERGIGERGLVERIMAAGKPALIACDKLPVPDTVLKISQRFQISLFSPNKVVTEEEKAGLAREAGVLFNNAHERDAYAAALKAYREAANRLRQIELLGEFGEEERDWLKHAVLNGTSLEEAKKRLLLRRGEAEKGRQKAEAVRAEVERPLGKKAELRLEQLREEVESLENGNQELRKALAAKEKENAELREELRRWENNFRQGLRKDQEIRKREGLIQRLQAALKWRHKQKEKQEVAHKRHGENEGRKPPEKPKPAAESKDGKAGGKIPQDFDRSRMLPREHNWQTGQAVCHGMRGEASKPHHNLKNLGNKVDLEGIITDYRKKRKDEK